MARKKIYQAFGYEITIDEAAKAACVSRAAFYAQLSALGGSVETVLRMYDKRYGGVMERLKQIKEDVKMSKPVGNSTAARDEAAKEQILNILFDADRAASVPVETVADEPETVSAEPIAVQAGEPAAEQAEEAVRPCTGWDSREWAQSKAQPTETQTTATGMPLAVELEEVKPDRGALKLLNDAIEALEKLSDSGWEMSAKVRRDATAMVEGWKNERLMYFKDLIDWRALEG